jgi:CRP/FNR family cyclic AMP-dependent transcriptional regulator
MTGLKAASWESLREVPLFQNLDENEIKELFSIGAVQNHDAYSNIIIEGEQSTGMYLVLEGATGVFKTDRASGKTYDICQLRQGAIFGEFSLVDDQPRSANIRSLTECQLLFFAKDKFLSYLTRQSDRRVRFLEGCIRALVGRMRELDQEYVQSQYQLWTTALKVNKEAA